MYIFPTRNIPIALLKKFIPTKSMQFSIDTPCRIIRIGEIEIDV